MLSRLTRILTVSYLRSPAASSGARNGDVQSCWHPGVPDRTPLHPEVRFWRCGHDATDNQLGRTFQPTTIRPVTQLAKIREDNYLGVDAVISCNAPCSLPSAASRPSMVTAKSYTNTFMNSIAATSPVPFSPNFSMNSLASLRPAPVAPRNSLIAMILRPLRISLAIV